MKPETSQRILTHNKLFHYKLARNGLLQTFHRSPFLDSYLEETPADEASEPD